MAEKMPIEKKKVCTPKFRVSFPHVFKPNSFKGQAAKFSIVMLFDKKTTDMKSLQAAAHNAAVEKWGADKSKWPEDLTWPFKDGDKKKDLMGYKGCTTVSASAKDRPGVVDQKRDPITEESRDFYAGCYARATLIAFAYDTAGNQGVSFALQNVQKWADGEQFSGRRKAEDEFDSIEDTSDDPSAYGSSGDEPDMSDMGL